jgi:hypothetical protein
MTLKILALLVSLISIAISLSSPPSDAYQVGYAEGRCDLHTESRAVHLFNQCVKEKKAPETEQAKAAKACWQTQIEWTKTLYKSWDAMTDQQKIDHVKQSAQTKDGIRWADILRGNGDSKVMPPLPVEIK